MNRHFIGKLDIQNTGGVGVGVDRQCTVIDYIFYRSGIAKNRQKQNWIGPSSHGSKEY